jgi:ATP-dependent protease ClpP protease subunit
MRRPYRSNDEITFLPEFKSPGFDFSAPVTVETVDNHVWFYAEVDPDRCLETIRRIKEIDIRLLNERYTRDLPDDFPHVPIWLHVNSPGGDLFSGFDMADQLRSIRSPIYSIVEGLCASAATFVALPCDKRYIRPLGKILIHQFWTMHWGSHSEFEDEMKLQKDLMEDMVAFYRRHSGVTKKSLRQMLKHDTWFNAKEALDLGFVDKII